MKKILLFLLMVITYNQSQAQASQNFYIRDGIRLLEYDEGRFYKFMSQKEYSYISQSSNFVTYNKKTRVSSYDFTVVVKAKKISVVSWDEYLGNFRSITNELDGMDFVIVDGIKNQYNGRNLINYRNSNRNLTITLITKGNYFTVTIAVFDPKKSFGKQSVYDAIELRQQKKQEAEEKVERAKAEQTSKEEMKAQEQLLKEQKLKEDKYRSKVLR